MFTAPAAASPPLSAASPSPSTEPPERPRALRALLRHYHSHTQHSTASRARDRLRTPGTQRQRQEQEQGQTQTQTQAPSSPAAQSKSRARAATSAATVTPPPPATPASPSSSYAPAAAAAAAAAAAPALHDSSRPPALRSNTAPQATSPTHTQTHTQTPASPSSPTSHASPLPPTMTRTRAETTTPQLTVRNHSGPIPTTPTMASSAATPASQSATDDPKNLPSIRFIMHQDPRAARPSLSFSTIQRTLPDESAVIKVGRYSERDIVPEVPRDQPSAAAVGFKSKVVSRKHCELWCKNGEWWIKDVKSSSGTFLNHIRLSQPNQESKPFKLKDGDIIQLGIDFRGGEEMIFRCVKIRIECNRGWQQSLNAFNKQTHQRLRNLAKARKDDDNASTHTSECSICLMSIAPCQSLFVAPCSHVWHYKCIRPILNGPTFPNFLCPNCRAVTDLEADVDDPVDMAEWEDEPAPGTDESLSAGEAPREDRHITPRASTNALNTLANEQGWNANEAMDFRGLEAAISNISIAESLSSVTNTPLDPVTPLRSPPQFASSSVTQPVSINVTAANESVGLTPLQQRRTGSSEGLSPNGAPEGPMTPRNDAGPFVLDGSGSIGRAAGQRFRDAEQSSSSDSSLPLPS